MMREKECGWGGREQTYTEEEGNRVREARQTDAEEESDHMLRKRATRVLRKRATRC